MANKRQPSRAIWLHPMSRNTSVIARRLLPWVTGTLLIVLAAQAAETDTSLELEVKAAFLYNFAKFVTWPTNTFPSVTSPFVIGVLADMRMTKTVEKMMTGKLVGNRAIAVRQINDPRHIETCEMLFVARSKMELFPTGLSPLQNSPVLLVGESPGFLAAGGTVNFTNDEGQVRFEVSAALAERAGLKISSKLLRLATNVATPHGETGE